MTNPNWKAIAAGSIKCPDVATPLPPALVNDREMAAKLGLYLSQEKVAARDVDFARSICAGFAKFGSFTERQRPHVERLIARIETAAPAHDGDKVLADELKALLDDGWLTIGDAGFADSMLAGLARFGAFTDRQRPYVEQLIDRAKTRRGEAQNIVEKAPQSPPATTSAQTGTVVAGQPSDASQSPALIVVSGICATVNLDKFSRFTVGNLQLSLKNDGTLIWVKWSGKIAGSIVVATGVFRPTYRYLSMNGVADAMQALVRINVDPMKAARENGVRTGRCSCCGRALTDPVSIGFGIGPVCRARGWGIE